MLLLFRSLLDAVKAPPSWGNGGGSGAGPRLRKRKELEDLIEAAFAKHLPPAQIVAKLLPSSPTPEEIQYLLTITASITIYLPQVVALEKKLAATLRELGEEEEFVVLHLLFA